MPVGNQLNYWNGTAWVPHAAATGDQGPVGEQGPPVSAGMCGFTCRVDALAPGIGQWATNFAVIPGVTDKEPCLTVKSPDRLQVARPGTIMTTAMFAIRGASVGYKQGFSYIDLQSTDGYRWAFNAMTVIWTDLSGAAGVSPNMPLGQDLGIYLLLGLTATAPVDVWFYAAVTP